MGVEKAGAVSAKGKGPASAGPAASSGGAKGANSSGKNQPAPTGPPVRQFANQLQQDIEDVTVEVNTPATHKN